jgi:GNAT superfamily N-acetyltransferase
MNKPQPKQALERAPMPGAWCERVWLEDGRELWVRPIQPADAAPIRAAFPLLRPEEIRNRYMHALKELSEEYAHRLTHPEPGREFVLVASEPLPPGDALVGAVARLSVDADGRAEFAILVSHFLAGQGLGRHLLRRVIEWGKRKRLVEIYGDVLDDNLPMLELAHELGFRRDNVHDTPGVTHIHLALRPVEARRAG